MTERTKLRACWVMTAVGLLLTLDTWRFLHVPHSSRAGSAGKQTRPVSSPGRRT